MYLHCKTVFCVLYAYMPVIVRDDLSLKSGYNVYDLDIIVQIKRTELEEYLSLKSLNSSVHVQRDCLRRLLQTCSTSSAAEGRRESFGQQWGGVHSSCCGMWIRVSC